MSVAPNSASVSGYEARWEQHNAERRAQILLAMIELLEESPPGADISVAAIAKRAGVAKSVIYRQTSGKEELERRVRSYLIDDFGSVLVSKLDISDGSLREILTRTIEAVADWMIDHPRLNEFARSGPSFEGDETLDAVGELKLRIIERADGIIAAIQLAIGVEDSAFKLVPLAIVTMVEETLFAWVRTPEPTHTRDEMIAHLADFTWYVIDGAARAIGFEVSRDEPLVAVVAALANRQANNPAL
ncbi:TetR/AcrR family transcriptional regulator [Mycobacterium sp. SMC-18]|uniref:TetR/AcrR family transcriptional regulator n=1 Tax=Mycobacteriaceae TaxID=1762 RepID=UPI00299DF02D|nr:TetR/AcrR family transcriptional regulator [Mycolicibacterium sp. 141076]MDX1881633.1 TetR/AcrR family transcriptional regulator [Mycolicibacterium sp. 141076]